MFFSYVLFGFIIFSVIGIICSATKCGIILQLLNIVLIILYTLISFFYVLYYDGIEQASLVFLAFLFINSFLFTFLQVIGFHVADFEPGSNEFSKSTGTLLHIFINSLCIYAVLGATYHPHDPEVILQKQQQEQQDKIDQAKTDKEIQIRHYQAKLEADREEAEENANKAAIEAEDKRHFEEFLKQQKELDDLNQDLLKHLGK